MNRTAPFMVALGLGAAAVAFPSAARAQPILEPDPVVDGLAADYERQQDTFGRAEAGQSFDSFVFPEHMQLVTDFFGQGEDFQTFTGMHPFEVVERFDEHGDMGNFSGIASVGLAARLLVLKRDGAPAEEIARAREACLRAAESWHVFGTIAGPGTVARGVQRIVPREGEPDLPGEVPELVPLADANGDPLPEDKVDTWRAPVAEGLEEWIWIDNTSKDQVSGYALAVLWLVEALRGDPEAPQEIVDALADDLARFARNLMVVVPELDLDLVVVDADGRPTAFGDLNARLLGGTGLEPLPEDSPLRNGFNAALAMGIMRAAYHVSGDQELGRFYYEELVGRREYPRWAAENAALVYFGEGTNYSNVNMLAIALATLGRIESDPVVREDFASLVDSFWDGGSSRAANVIAQPWFDVVVAGFGRAPKLDVPDRMRENLGGHGPVPTFQRDRVNCDEAEIEAGECLGIDGVTTLVLADGTGWNGTIVATEVVPLTIRPDTNFLWRSDPHGVNGGGGNRLNPRGDWLAAYWLGRLLDRDPGRNVVDGPPALDTDPPGTGGGGGAGVGGGEATGSGAPQGVGGSGGATGDAAREADDGCGCSAPRGSRSPGSVGVLLALAWAVARARRTQGAARVAHRQARDPRRAPPTH